MKKQIFIFLLTLFSFSNYSSAQAVEGGDIEASFALGFGLYGTDNNFDDNDGIALPGLVNLRAEYALAKWFSLGFMYERNGYITDPDSSENAQSNNIYLALRFRLVNTEKTEVHTSLDLGSSNYKYEQERDKREVTSSGGATQFGFGLKHYISDHIAIGYDFGMAIYSYDKLEVDGQDEPLQFPESNGELTNFEITFAGINHRIGVTYKF